MLNTIKKEHFKTTYFIPSALTEYQKEIITYAIEAYSFVLPSGAYTYAQFADAIEKHYDMSTPENKEVVDVLRSINVEGETKVRH